jgi:histidyl-tRNA synthetase
MKKADASGARFAVILGDAEVQSGQVSLKPLRSEGSQQLLPLAEAINEMR